jgi:hypothetical protein
MSRRTKRFVAQPSDAGALFIPLEALDPFLATAFRLYRHGHHSEVEALCRGLIVAAPASWYPHALLAASLCGLERFDEAVAACDHGLAHDPTRADLLALLRKVLRARELGRSGRAICAMPPPRPSNPRPMRAT